MRVTRPIALVGLMGAGKSAVAVALGRRMSGRVADLDARIEAAAGMTVAALFASRGESEFRDHESRELARAMAESTDAIACGGGVVLDPGNRALLRNQGHTVWLDVAPDIAARRIEAARGLRPLLGDAPAEPQLRALLADRASLYAEVSVVRLDTSHHTPATVAELVLVSLAGRDA